MTWQKKQISNHLYSIENIYFINQDEGWLTGEGISYGKATDDSACGVVFQTKDSGNSWTEISPPIKYRGHIKDVFFINSQVGWISGEYGLVMKTTDGGKSWKQQSSGTANNLNKIFFIDDKTGWIVGDFGTILFTNTGGE